METALPNIPRFYTALAEWSACMLYIFLYRRSIKGIAFWSFAGAGLIVFSVFFVLTGSLPLGFWMLCMALAVGMMYLMFLLCSEMTPIASGYWTVRAFILAELAASLEWQIYLDIFYKNGLDDGWISLACVVVIYGLIFAVMYRLENWHPNQRDALPVEPADLYPTIFMGIAVFFASNIGFVGFRVRFDNHSWYQIYKTRTLVDLAGVVIMFVNYLQRSVLYMRKEYDTIQNVLQSQYIQYQRSKESIDLINRKYHDLKHQIAVLRAETDLSRQEAYLKEMEKGIRDYEVQNKTGNSVLDTVLTNKSFSCSENHIQFICVADGSLLSNMDVMDICTIFGNALDNAIECEMGISDEEKRVIQLALFSKKDFVVIRIENYFEGALDFKEGLPVTTKKDTDYHGYGIKSIRYTVEKYGGNVYVSTHENWFELGIIIPKMT